MGAAAEAVRAAQPAPTAHCAAGLGEGCRLCVREWVTTAALAAMTGLHHMVRKLRPPRRGHRRARGLLPLPMACVAACVGECGGVGRGDRAVKKVFFVGRSGGHWLQQDR